MSYDWASGPVHVLRPEGSQTTYCALTLAGCPGLRVVKLAAFRALPVHEQRCWSCLRCDRPEETRQ